MNTDRDITKRRWVTFDPISKRLNFLACRIGPLTTEGWKSELITWGILLRLYITFVIGVLEEIWQISTAQKINHHDQFLDHRCLLLLGLLHLLSFILVISSLCCSSNVLSCSTYPLFMLLDFFLNLLLVTVYYNNSTFAKFVLMVILYLIVPLPAWLFTRKMLLYAVFLLVPFSTLYLSTC